MRLEVFQEGRDVYVDYPFEDVMFRWEYQSKRVFRKFYDQAEVEVHYSSNMFHEAISAGQQITAEQYTQGKPVNQEETKYRLEVIGKGHNVYLDDPFEHVMFRWEYQTKKVFRKFYGEAEVEIDYTPDLLRKVITVGGQITAEEYAQGKSADQKRL